MKILDLLDSLFQTLQGVRLVKFVAFLVIAAVMILVTAPAVSSFINEVEGLVCECNRKMIATHYALYLQDEKLSHNDVVFAQFLGVQKKSLCPSHGDITFLDGKIGCSAHPDRVVEMQITIEKEMPLRIEKWMRCVKLGCEKRSCLNGSGSSEFMAE